MPPRRRTLPTFYDCGNCPGYCCSYPQIEVTDADVERLAVRFDISIASAQRRFTTDGLEEGTRILRHKEDDIFETVCRFLDSETRRCTVYQHRPDACRAYPGTVRCGYYDFLSSERRRQEDPDLVLTAYETDLG